MKKLALNLLAWLASLVAKKYRVKIVAITGSVGKTTAKEAIWTVLSQAYSAQRSLYNANTEWSICASVISPGFEPTFTSSGKARVSLVQYLGLIWQAKLKLLFNRPYPQVLVLEMAADRPGDIRWFNKWFDYDVAVVTTIGSTHLDYYRDQAELTGEKLALTKKVKPDGLVVINGECEECQGYIAKPDRRCVTFGMSDKYDYWYVPTEAARHQFHHKEREIRPELPVGRQWTPAALMAWAAGDEFGMTDEQVMAGLRQLQPVAGRFQIHKTSRFTVIDDTYNAAPESMKVALESLKDLARGRRVAILGEMRELGDKKETRHLELGALAAKKVDLLVAMGEAGKLIANGARQAGMPNENIVELAWDPQHAHPDSVMSQLLPILQDNDTVLVKASRTIYLDKVVKRLLA